MADGPALKKLHVDELRSSADEYPASHSDSDFDGESLPSDVGSPLMGNYTTEDSSDSPEMPQNEESNDSHATVISTFHGLINLAEIINKQGLKESDAIMDQMMHSNHILDDHPDSQAIFGVLCVRSKDRVAVSKVTKIMSDYKDQGARVTLPQVKRSKVDENLCQSKLYVPPKSSSEDDGESYFLGYCGPSPLSHYGSFSDLGNRSPIASSLLDSLDDEHSSSSSSSSSSDSPSSTNRSSSGVSSEAGDQDGDDENHEKERTPDDNHDEEKHGEGEYKGEMVDKKSH